MGGPATIDGRAQRGTDNFLHAEMVIDGVRWPTCEHYFQAVKFLGTEPGAARHLEKIRQVQSGGGALGLGQSRNFKLRPDWEASKAAAMYRAVSTKYAQHESLAEELRSTTGRISAAPSTSNWQVLNSAVLERVRHDLRIQAGMPSVLSEAELSTVMRLTVLPEGVPPLVVAAFGCTEVQR